MTNYEIWTEGYITNGNRSDATYHGTFSGESFKSAIEAFRNSLTDQYSIVCIDINSLTFWGCRFFDNEQDARKLYG